MAALMDAMRKYIDAVSRTQAAVIRREQELAGSLDDVVARARRRKQQAVEAFKEHLTGHSRDRRLCA